MIDDKPTLQYIAGMSLIHQLLAQGVHVPQPETVYVAPEIQPQQIAPNVTIYPGCRLLGASTAIGPGSQLGLEAPLTIDSCQLGANVQLRGGYACKSVFLNQAQVGSCAHIRPGTLIEEAAGGAHTVGLKQTILMPYVTLGSLVNFCDCLMAGGTSNKNHSEVGSSYIHFNFTPHQNKATPSLLGNVPEGVFLNQTPIFLGGQGGLVGPAQICFGAIIAAGTIVRGQVTTPGLHTSQPLANAHKINYRPGCYRNISRLLTANLNYIGNILALQAWYRHIRALFMQADPYRQACHTGALACLELIIKERMHWLDDLAARMPRSLELHGSSISAEQAPGSDLYEQQHFYQQWQAWRAQILSIKPELWQPPPALLELIKPKADSDYLTVIQSLPQPVIKDASQSLAELVASVIAVIHHRREKKI